VAAALERHPQARLLGIVHAETSTGAHQPLAGLAELVHARGALLVVDAVTSLGGHELRVDDWGIDACYSGTQKCLSCPPGLAPVTFGERALARLDARKTKVQSWYLDVSMLRNYYVGGSGGRFYHHTAPINMTYALREALANNDVKALFVMPSFQNPLGSCMPADLPFKTFREAIAPLHETDWFPWLVSLGHPRDVRLVWSFV